MYITILGSCRQKPLEKYFNVTCIQESLTYPHYTKEIIQTIEYCKDEKKIAINDTQNCFRTGILNKKPITNHETLHNQFNNTDLFVIEIASRIAYKYDNLYVHHILTQKEFGFNNRQNIIIYNLTDEEIENDLIKIKELLHPKKILVVSHIYTYKTGKRYELIKLLKYLCEKHSLPFLSPSDHFNTNDDLYVKNEKVLSHFSSNGTELIGNLYKEVINNFI